uniref:Putative ldlr chaperone boca n=1 Tax=Phlebotomus kandelakii TaxID=1109342 RepID=A0A6B2EE30_9DIPT
MRRTIFLLLAVLLVAVGAKKSEEGSKPHWAKKDIRDYTDADMERLLEQWEEDEEPLEPDELPEHLRPQKPIDLTKLDVNNPEEMVRESKKGRTVMTFVQVAGNPTREESETLTKIWQSSLWNNHIQAERYMIEDARAIFMFKDGAQAWQAKDFLVEQENCESVTIESKKYPGKYSKAANEEL